MWSKEPGNTSLLNPCHNCFYKWTLLFTICQGFHQYIPLQNEVDLCLKTMCASMQCQDMSMWKEPWSGDCWNLFAFVSDHNPSINLQSISYLISNKLTESKRSSKFLIRWTILHNDKKNNYSPIGTSTEVHTLNIELVGWVKVLTRVPQYSTIYGLSRTKASIIVYLLYKAKRSHIKEGTGSTYVNLTRPLHPISSSIHTLEYLEYYHLIPVNSCLTCR